MNTNALTIIEEEIRAPETIGKLMLALGHDDPKDAHAKNDAKRYASSVVAELQKMALDEKKRVILQCTPQSIVQTMVDAAKFRLMIDGRQHAHIVKYGNDATLQIGYRGYIAKIAEHYDNADINVFPVYKGDVLTITGGDGFDRYTHDRAKPFNDDQKDFEGVVAVLYYTKGDQKFQKIITMSAAEIGKIRKAAKQDFVWSAWFIEKAKAAAIKRICKVQFASISLLQEMIEYDNRKHFDIEKPIEDVKAGSIIDNLNQGLGADKPAGAPESDDAIEGVSVRVDYYHAAPASDMPKSDPDLEKDAQAVLRMIEIEETAAGLAEIFEKDFKPEVDRIKAKDPQLFKYLEEQYIRRESAILKGGAQ
jgi:phage RecT family recombinase